MKRAAPIASTPEGKALSDEDRAALIGGQSWLNMHEVFAIWEEHAPEKISEMAYSSERDRQMSQATMRVIRREPGRRRTPRSVGTPRRRESHSTRPGHRRSSSSSSTSSADPGSGDSDPAGPPAAPAWRRFTVDSHYCVVELGAAS